MDSEDSHSDKNEIIREPYRNEDNADQASSVNPDSEDTHSDKNEVNSESWDEWVKSAAVFLSKSEQYIRDRRGIYDNNFRQKFIISDELLEIIKSNHIKKFKKLYSKSGLRPYDFNIFPRSSEFLEKNYLPKYFYSATQKIALEPELDIIAYALARISKYPNEESCISIGKRYNQNLNNLIQKLSISRTLIVFPIEPINREKKTKNEWKQGIICEPISNMIYDKPDDDAPLFIKECYDFLDKGLTLEEIRKQRPDIYDKVTEYHRLNMALIHGREENGKFRKCACPTKNVQQILELMQIKTKRLNTEPTPEVLQRFIPTYYTTFGKYKRNVKTDRFKKIFIKKGTNYCECPCSVLNEQTNQIEPCQALIEISSRSEQLFTHLINLIPNINTRLLFSKWFKDKSSQLQESHRLNVTCPKCNTIISNSFEAMRNEKGLNPKFRHPSDITCTNMDCNHRFCSDCKEVHIGKICRGFPLDFEPYKDAQACPCCSVPCFRYDGCTFMTCSECDKNWCWECRCLRMKEYQLDSEGKYHYCITPERYQLNSDWISENGTINKDVNLYETNPPRIDDQVLNRFVPQ